MIDALVFFLSNNKEIIGAVIGIGQGFVILFNLWRKFRVTTSGEVESMSSSPSKFKIFLWVINPVNCFRKPK